MALTLPYPTYSAFTQSTVHSSDVHNTPHVGLLSNDAYLKDQLDLTNAAVAAADTVGRRFFVLREDYVVKAPGAPYANSVWYPIALPIGIFPNTITALIFRTHIYNNWRVGSANLYYKYSGSSSTFWLSTHRDDDSSGADISCPIVPISNDGLFSWQFVGGGDGGAVDFIKITGYVY